MPTLAQVREEAGHDGTAGGGSQHSRVAWSTLDEDRIPTMGSPENAPVGVTRPSKAGLDKLDELSDSPHLQEVMQQLKSQRMRNTGFAPTLRHMFYRSFRRQYLGTHQRTWGPLTTVFLLLFVSALNLTIYAVSCQTAFMTAPLSLSEQNGHYASLMFSGITLMLMFGILIMCRTPSAYGASAYVSLVYLIIDIVCLLGLVVLTTRSAEVSRAGVSARKLKTLMEGVRGYILSPETHFIEDFQSATQLFGDGNHLLGQSCENSSSRFFILHWFLLSYQGLQFLIVLCDILWMRVLSRVGAWYYLRSNIFANGWFVDSVRPVRFLVPTQGRTSVRDIPEGIPTQQPLGRFQVRSGLCVELVGSIAVNRFVNWLSKAFCLKSSTPTDKVPREGQSRWRIVYTGQFDREGRPEGFGYWLGDEMLGENLIGFWSEGLPSGPTKSREVTSGSGLACIKLGWARCLLSEKRLEFGVALVECSVSGRFFRGFPDVRTYNAPLIKKRDSGILQQAKRQLEKMMKEGKRVVHPSGYVAEVPELQTKDQPEGWYPRQQSIELARSQSMGIAPSPVPPAFGLERRANSTHRMGLYPPTRARSLRWWPRGDRGNRDFNLMKELKAREVIRNYRESVKWILDQLHLHTPAFSLQGQSEVTISVDRERGLSVLGFAPIEQVMVQQNLFRDQSSFGDMFATALTSNLSFQSQALDNPRQNLMEAGGGSAPILPSLNASPIGAAVHEQNANVVGTPGLLELANDRELAKAASGSLKVRGRPPPMETRDRMDHHGFGLHLVQPFSGDGSSKASSQPEPHQIPNIAGSAREIGSIFQKVQVSVFERFALGPADDPLLNLIDISVPELAVQGWIPMESIGLSEVLIYVHGFNNSQQECQQTLGQMAAFGNLPAHLKVLVFTWPAGAGALTFFTAQSAAEDPVCHEAFTQLLVSLQHNDVRQVHIMAHSMGSRLFLKSLRGILQRGDILMAQGDDAHTGKIQLISTTLMNPEYSTSDFLNLDYELLRSCCSNITIYADGNDRALWWSELFSGRQALGRCVRGLRSFASNSKSLQETEGPRGGALMQATSFVQVDGYQNEWTRFEPKQRNPRRNRGKRQWTSLRVRKEFDTDEMLERTGEWLDVDIIDTTFMDRNVGDSRHSFWNLNREIIEDLRELLVTRKRARQRNGRLDRRDGNVWVFRVAPSFLTSIFESP